MKSKEPKKKCKQCFKLKILEIDPHNRCKTCRQPDIEQYFCSDSDCDDCKKIKSRPPLYYVLQKREMGKITKKINIGPQFNPNLSSSNKTLRSRGRPRSKKYFSGSDDSNMVVRARGRPRSKKYSSGSDDSSSSSIHGHKNNILSAKDKIPGNKAKENRSSHVPGTSASSNYEPGTSVSFPEDLQNLLSKVMSLLPNNSLSSEARTVLSNQIITNNSSKSSNEHVIPQINCEASSSNKQPFSEHSFASVNAGNFTDNLVSLYKLVNPSALALSNPCSITGNNDFAFKISSSACNILYKSTILFSPAHAEDLKKQLKLEEDCQAWPSDLSATILLNNASRQLPAIKLLPKIRTLQRMLYGKINATLPKGILADDLILPSLSLNLNNEFIFAREQLQRIIFMMSMIDQFQGEYLESNIPIQNLFKLIVHLLEESLKEQANYLGLVIQRIRRELLHDVVGHDPSVISKLIMGPVDEFQFFGPYARELQSYVKENGATYCLKPSKKPSMKLIQLPKPFKVGTNIKLFLKDLVAYYTSNRNAENDYATILENLLPKEIFERLIYLIKPCKLADKKLEEIVIYLENICKNKADSIVCRFSFNRTSQDENQTLLAYAKELEKKVISCDYGTMERELLRDQFIFGLKNKDLSQELMTKFNFGYEECVDYAISNEKKFSQKKICSSSTAKTIVIPQNPVTLKRKVETHPEKILIKKVKLNAESFYKKYAVLYDSPKKEIVTVCNTEEWNKIFGCKAIYSYATYCPWSGRILRA